MKNTLALPELVDAPPADDPFCYGTRMARRRQDDGSYTMERLPLTIWDVLHPQEGDHIVQSIRHSKEVRYLASAIEAKVAHDKHALVLSDTGIYWDVPGLSHHSPDVAVIFNIEERKDNYPSFFVKGEGVRPSLIIEVVSPLTLDGRRTDTITKVIEYHAARVPFYVIVDREREEDWPTVLGYRWAPEAYERIALDDHGCLLLPDLGLRLCANQNRITLYDAVTGDELGDYTAISQALEAEVAARQAAEEQARIAREQARVALERARAEEEARRLAEEKARTGEEARLRAEQAQHRAEQETRTQQAAFLDLERQLRELQARLLDRPDTNPTS